ncbi:hypothetical protein PRZ48_004294 [Zasmidium cellare]|uniref:Uncharacterized protein n=1 Tax=Zasmidium cellare TaxID=395010 RepID=A0ABR0EP81_ZASCE|nr:hypothetical protein PRZ48_004294 [Zasmidium cellare]
MANASSSVPHPTSPTTLSNTANKGIIIPSDLLSQAQVVQSPPAITNLGSDQHIAELEIPNTDGTANRIFLVVQQQKPPTQSSGPHPGDASYYDDCVSDYSHQPTQPSSPPPPFQTPSQRPKRTSADYGRMPEILAANAARARRQMAPSIVSAPLGDNFVLMPTGVGYKFGEWFKVLKVYTVKATTTGKAIGIQAKAGLRQGAKGVESVTAHLVSFGKTVLAEFENSVTQASSNRALQPPRELKIEHMPTHNEIDPAIKLWPVEHVLANDLRRRAEYGRPRFPPQQAISRKPAPLPKDGPLADIKLPGTSGSSADRRKPSRHQQKWEEPFQSTVPRECKTQAVKPTVTAAFEVRSQKGSLMAVSVAGSATSRSTAKSPGSSQDAPAPFRFPV